jgi:hypothetical protein
MKGGSPAPCRQTVELPTTAPFNSGRRVHFGTRQSPGDRHWQRTDGLKRNTVLPELYMKDESARAADLEFAFR